MTSNPTEQFAAALNQFEDDRDLDAFVKIFADQAELHRPETGQEVDGDSGARQFWQEYRAMFGDIHSDFSRITDAGVGVLEWTSTGTLSNGSPIEYAGVSILDFAEDGSVTRFTTYFDTQAFSHHD